MKKGRVTAKFNLGAFIIPLFTVVIVAVNMTLFIGGLYDA
jgi:hypothetical protein